MKGSYKARAVVGLDGENKPISGLRTSKTKQTPEFFILFEIVEEGAMKGKRVPWDGWLTPSTEDRTLEALILCGLENDDLQNPIGIDKNIVLIVVDEEEYEVDVEKTDPVTGEMYLAKEKRRSNRVQWVNDPARSGSVHKPMEGTEATAFAQRMQGAVMAARARRGQGGGGRAPSPADGEFKFGANALPPAPAGEAAPAAAPAAAPVSSEAKAPNPVAGY
jgi:hypothetical protein